MDLFMRAIGFSGADEEKIIRIVKDEPDERFVLGKNKDDVYVQFNKKFGDDFGYTVFGIMDKNEDVLIKDSYPYAFGGEFRSYGNVEFDTDFERYLVLCEDENSGFEYIFKLQNIVPFMSHSVEENTEMAINMAGLSVKGTVILPIAHDDEVEEYRALEESIQRDLVKRAKNGDEQAREQLESREMETTEAMHERLLDEDFLTVVEGFFIPDEDDDTMYSILGDIVQVSDVINGITGETVYKMRINITGSLLDLYINSQDLTGMPIEGMRFMGSCFIQGKVKF